MKVLILGAGKVGGSLATALVNNDYDVSIVDQNITIKGISKVYKELV